MYINRIIKKTIKHIIPNYYYTKLACYYKSKKLLNLLKKINGKSITDDSLWRINQFHKNHAKVRFVEIPVNVIATFCISVESFMLLKLKDNSWYNVLILIKEDKNKDFKVPNEALYHMLCREVDEVVTVDNACFWIEYIKKYKYCIDIYDFGGVWTDHIKKIQDSLNEELHLKKTMINMNALFTDQDKIMKKKVVSQLNIKKPYICIFSRDSGYYKRHVCSNNVNEINQLFSVYRDSDIYTYTFMAHALKKRGFSIVRIGNCVEKKCDESAIIDYSNIAVSPFNDLAICSGCEFFIGDLSGIVEILNIFARPTILINVGVALNYNDMGCIGTLMIYQKYYDTNSKKHLSLRDICKIQKKLYKENNKENGAVAFWKFLQKKHIIVEKNSEKDILRVCEEMIKMINGEKMDSQKIIRLRQRQRKILKEYQINNMPIIYAPVGTDWALENEWFFE